MKQKKTTAKLFSKAGWMLLIALSLQGCLKEQRGEIYITSNPTHAELLLNGEKMGSTPLTISELAAGKYILQTKKKNYKDHYTTVYLRTNQKLELNLSIQKKSGLLLAESTPSGADVSVNGISKGFTPVIISDLPFGTHLLSFSATGRRTETIEVEITERKPQAVFAKLESSLAMLSVTTSPQGAEVRIDGRPVGHTPVMIDDVSTGEATITISKPGHDSVVKRVIFEPSKRTEIHAHLKAFPDGLTIITEPIGAAVKLDKKEQGEAPITLSNLPEGKHTISVNLKGYAPKTKNIHIKNNLNQQIKFKLKKDSGTLLLTTEPAQVEVYINDKLIATTPIQAEHPNDNVSSQQSISLKANRTHTIRLRKDNFVSQTLNITPKIDQVITRHQKLREIFFYDTKIISTKGIINGKLIDQLSSGNIYIESAPGTYQTIEAVDLIEIKPISLDDEINQEALNLTDSEKELNAANH